MITPYPSFKLQRVRWDLNYSWSVLRFLWWTTHNSRLLPSAIISQVDSNLQEELIDFHRWYIDKKKINFFKIYEPQMTSALVVYFVHLLKYQESVELPDDQKAEAFPHGTALQGWTHKHSHWQLCLVLCSQWCSSPQCVWWRKQYDSCQFFGFGNVRTLRGQIFWRQIWLIQERSKMKGVPRKWWSVHNKWSQVLHRLPMSTSMWSLVLANVGNGDSSSRIQSPIFIKLWTRDELNCSKRANLSMGNKSKVVVFWANRNTITISERRKMSAWLSGGSCHFGKRTRIWVWITASFVDLGKMAICLQFVVKHHEMVNFIHDNLNFSIYYRKIRSIALALNKLQKTNEPSIKIAYGDSKFPSGKNWKVRAHQVGQAGSHEKACHYQSKWV